MRNSATLIEFHDVRYSASTLKIKDVTVLNTEFDFRQDTPPGKDPDARSPTLRKYHKQLWSKRLPSGDFFELDDKSPKAYLHHYSILGEFFLASDSAVPTFRKYAALSGLLNQVPQNMREEFSSVSCTIGRMIVFPGNRFDRKMTINGARGLHNRIRDRFDLTVECIRRHYANEISPLSDTLNRYREFFSLFGDFQGYVEFFLLQDMAAEDYCSVRFFLPFDNFTSSPLPKSLESYQDYRKLAISFIQARGKRMLQSLPANESDVW